MFLYVCEVFQRKEHTLTINLRLSLSIIIVRMRKKQANPYKPIKSLAPPYLTREQMNEFQSEFTLLDKQLSIKRLREIMISQNYSKTDKIVIQFIEELKGKEKIGFQEYVHAMIDFFQRQNMNDVIAEMLADPQNGEISKETVKEILEDSLGRDINLQELNSIMEELKKDEEGIAKLKKSNSFDISQN